MTKPTGAQSPMMTKKYTKFEKDSLKDSREKLRTKVDGRTNGRTDRQTGRFQYTPPQLVGGGYNNGWKGSNPLVQGASGGQISNNKLWSFNTESSLWSFQHHILTAK